MALRCERTNDIGVYVNLTNSYCVLSSGTALNFYSMFEAELSQHIPVIHTSIGGTGLTGRCTVGNRKGLLVSNITTDQELLHIRNSLPEDVQIARVEERLSALGNIVACNDYVALVHPDIDRETEEIIMDTLGVEVFRQTVGGRSLVGTYCKFTNQGGLVPVDTKLDEMQQLSSLLQVPLAAGTVSRGTDALAAGLVVNDWSGFVGVDSTSTEIAVIDKIFKLTHSGLDNVGAEALLQDLQLRSTLIDNYV
ncbi:MAG: uncharacterized protein KVP18_004487 [Porospora cf. gigantea A]|uniref:uncharacterized protein n=2 Tax=Porospora cf. gigantea A TaxID=2853593 RepID=UPI00355A4E50|nr:MAG: hypothetical protein KVP18_004487 [Porospora cf. gigantea A]